MQPPEISPFVRYNFCEFKNNVVLAQPISTDVHVPTEPRNETSKDKRTLGSNSYCSPAVRLSSRARCSSACP